MYICSHYICMHTHINIYRSNGMEGEEEGTFCETRTRTVSYLEFSPNM